MNYRTMVKGALALSLSLIVGSASAAVSTNVPTYGATFESAPSAVAPLNDFAYTEGDGITNAKYRVTQDVAQPYGWFAGSDEDESKIITRDLGENQTGQALQLNTDAATLTNLFNATTKTAVNNALENEGTVFFETEVKFVASDTDSVDVEGGKTPTKFAIYAYSNEDKVGENENVTTNLVVFHAYRDFTDESLAANNYYGYTNEIFATPINTEVYTKLRIEMKQTTIGGTSRNLFSVKVGNDPVLTSPTAYDEGRIWFLTVEDVGDDGNKEVSSLNFKGTGEIDNISVGTIVMKVATVDGTDYATWEAALAAIHDGSVVTAFEDGSIDLASGTITLDKNSYNVTVTTSTTGKKIQDNGNGTYTVVDDYNEATVISIVDGTETGYATLADALAAAVAGDTVKLNGDVEVGSTVTISQNLVFDLGGYSLTNNAGTPVFKALAGNVVVTNGTLYGRVNCYDTSTLTIAADTTVEGYVVVWGEGTYGEAGCLTPTLNLAGTISAEGEGSCAIFNGASDTSKPNINILEGAVVNADWGVILNDAVVTMSGGTINAANRGIDAKGGSSVTLSGGTINATGSGIGLWEGSSLTMTGGDIVVGSYGVFNNGKQTTYSTTMDISGGTITSTNTVDTGCGIYQAGPGALTLSGTAVVSGPDAVEVRAGTVQVLDNARLVATAPYTAPASNGNGNSGHGGVALIVSQHTTAQAITATVSGGTLTGAVAFAEVTVEASNDASKIVGAINGGVLYGSVVSEDVEGLIPSTSTALFSDSEPEGLPEGFEVVEDLPGHPGLYKVQAQTFTVIFVADNETFATSNNIAYNAQVAAPAPAPTKADDDTYTYSFNGWQLGGVAYDFTTGVTSNFTLVADFTATEKPAPSAGYQAGDKNIGDIAELTSDQAAWLNDLRGETGKDAYTASFKAGSLTKCYLLNCDPTQATADGSITLTAITVGNDVQVTVSLSRTNGREGGINGTLKLFGKADLSTGEFADLEATVSNAKFTVGNTATAAKAASTAKFFKAVIE